MVHLCGVTAIVQPQGDDFRRLAGRQQPNVANPVATVSSLHGTKRSAIQT